MTPANTVVVRVARAEEIPQLNAMITESARALSVGFYTPEQIDAAIRYVFGVDSTLISDGTYFVAECDGEVAGCGGWSRRRTLYGGDQRPVGGSAFLDPATEAARVRAFFVAPRFARRGIGTALLDACADVAWRAGFRKLELMSTLPGVPLYASRGFAKIEDVVDVVPDGTSLSFVRMGCTLTSAPAGRWRLASEHDAEAIAALHIESWRATYRGLLPDEFLQSSTNAERSAEWRQTLRASPQLHVLLREVVGEGLVAFCAMAPSRDDDATASTWEIWNLHSAPDAHGLGYGTELFDAASRLASSHGTSALTLWVVVENEHARRFYERRGMVADGARKTHALAPNAELREMRYRIELPAST